MIVGVPKEVKNNEYRVSMVPAGVKSLVRGGHKVIVQESAGVGSGVADLVIGALLIPGARAHKVVTRAMLAHMRKGSVIVDVAIDQGGCVEGSAPTTHEHPVIDLDGVTLVCVANMPGCVARTSTFALINATFPYVAKLAHMGYKAALKADPRPWPKGFNVIQGKLVCSAVADSVGMACESCYDLN